MWDAGSPMHSDIDPLVVTVKALRTRRPTSW
jgi:hypothetical protein